MPTLSRILVTTDFSEGANRALPAAAALASAFGAELHLLNAVIPGEDISLEGLADELELDEARRAALGDPEQRARAGLAVLARRMERKVEGLRVHCCARHGRSAYDVILSYAQEQAVSLIVISTHGRTGLSYVLMGSIAEKVVHHAAVPVLVTRGRGPLHGDGGSFARILLPCDLSEASQKAVAFAGRLAQHFGAQVHLLHVLEQTSAPIRAVLGAGRVASEDAEELRGRATEILKGTLLPLLPPEVDKTVVVRRGHPAKEILAYAGEIDADLVTMTFRGYNELGDFLVGSTTERTLRKASCPVLVV